MENINQKASSYANPLLLRAAMENELRTRAYKDEAFQQALISDPRGVLEREYPHWFPHGKIPQGFTIRIIEEEGDSLNVVLLSKRAGTMVSLKEEDLTVVQGGGVGLSMFRDLKNSFESDTKHCGSSACQVSEHCASHSVVVC